MPFHHAWLVTVSRTISVEAEIVCRVYPECHSGSERTRPAYADIEDVRLGASGALSLDPDELDRYEQMEIEGSAVRAVVVAAVATRQPAAEAACDPAPHPELIAAHQKG